MVKYCVGDHLVWMYSAHQWTCGCDWYRMSWWVPTTSICLFVLTCCCQGKHYCHYSQWKVPTLSYWPLSSVFGISLMMYMYITVKIWGPKEMHPNVECLSLVVFLSKQLWLCFHALKLLSYELNTHKFVVVYIEYPYVYNYRKCRCCVHSWKAFWDLNFHKYIRNLYFRINMGLHQTVTPTKRQSFMIKSFVVEYCFMKFNYPWKFLAIHCNNYAFIKTEH